MVRPPCTGRIQGSKDTPPDAVWIGELTPCTDSFPKATYHRSRHDAVSLVLTGLVDHLKHQRRVLIGCDFPYGYPAGFWRVLGLGSSSRMAWLTIWAELSRRVKDNANNENNWFAVAHAINRMAGRSVPGPFWRCLASQATAYLQSQGRGFPFPAANGVSLPRLRIVETHLHDVQEAWKLYGAGSVGSQALVGISRLCHLRQHEVLRQHSQVWPLETNFTATPSPKQGPFIGQG